MKRSSKKILSLSEHKDMMSMLKQLYGNEDVKDDTKVCDTNRKTRAKGVGEVVKPTSTA